MSGARILSNVERQYIGIVIQIGMKFRIYCVMMAEKVMISFEKLKGFAKVNNE